MNAPRKRRGLCCGEDLPPGELERVEAAVNAEDRMIDGCPLVLPYPPSMNHYWRTARIGGRQVTYISEEGKHFRHSVALAVVKLVGTLPDLAGPIAVSLTLTRPDKRRRDLDNILKATLDALQHAGVYRDDSQIQKLCLQWEAGDKARCVVTIEEDTWR